MPHPAPRWRAALTLLGCTGLATAQTTATADPVLPAVRAQANAEPTSKDTLRASTTQLGKGTQELRDVPQSLTVVTERLIDDRHLDTLKDALKNTAGASFQAAEGGEEDIRLRGFSLQASGDIFIDGLRDPAFYERDSFAWDRLEVLRGSASMLFGRGSTGGVVNQVSKQPYAMTQHELTLTLGSGGYRRGTADFNLRTGDDAALRVNAMTTDASNHGAAIHRRGIAPVLRWGIGTRDEFQLGAYVLHSDNGIAYGLPWLPAGSGGGNGSNGLWPTDPRQTYGLASDRADSGTTQLSASHLHRFGPGEQIKSQLRVADYTRDQRASAIRFAPAALQPDGQAVTADSFGPDTVLARSGGNGAQLKNMSLKAAYAQSDYSGRQRWGGLDHQLQAGVDLAHERFANRGLTSISPVLIKPTTTVGTPDDGAWIDESARVLAVNRRFSAQGAGVYAQDLLQLNPDWKLLTGVRWDRLQGRYDNLSLPAAANNPCAVAPASQVSRADSLWSHRVGVLYQPTPLSSFHVSHATSFNTAGDTYQYDAGNAQVEPEGSRNIELGAKFDNASGDLSTRLALFHSTKTHERNRDAESVNACNYVLSGRRHAAGLEVDVSGRLARDWEVYLSYAFIPVARVDASSSAAGSEAVGSRPGLTPRHSGTVWVSWQASPRWRVGGGLNLRSADKPVGLATGSTIEAPGFVTTDLMAEYRQGELSWKLNLSNLSNRHVADQLYRGHYVPGAGRNLQLTAGWRFF